MFDIMFDEVMGGLGTFDVMTGDGTVSDNYNAVDDDDDDDDASSLYSAVAGRKALPDDAVSFVPLFSISIHVASSMHLRLSVFQ